MTYQTGDTPEHEARRRAIDGQGIAGVGWAWILVGILAIVIVALIGWWLWQGGNGVVAETRSLSLGSIVEESETLVDERVVVSGRVERLLTENAMTLGNDFVDAGLLVLTPRSAFVGPGGGAVAPGVAVPAGDDGTVAPFLEGQFVQITGIVRIFDIQSMTEDYGLVLAPELFESFEGESALITEVFDIAMRAPQIAAPVEEDVDAAAVLAEPEQFAGQAVRVEGGLGEVIADNLFTLAGPDGEAGLIVAGADTGRFDEVEAGHPVRVEGTILSFDAEALTEAGITLDPDLGLATLEGRPTIIPTAVDVLDEDVAEVTPQAD